MIASICSPERAICAAHSRCSTVRFMSSSSSVIPITPFIGVRISWLMFARNADFIAEASTAWSRAAASSAAARLRSPTSWQRHTRQRRPEITTSSLVTSTSRIDPSLQR